MCYIEVEIAWHLRPDVSKRST